MERHLFESSFRQVLKSEDVSSLVVHTDVVRSGIFNGIRRASDLADAYYESIIQGMEGRPLLLPSFNYDFCKSGVYDVENDRCQVGALNEHFRKRHLPLRTRTPVFNFVIINGPEFSLEPGSNVFGSQSTFSQMVSSGAHVAFLGATFSSNTFVHHVEELAGIGYRYLKSFSGVIRHGSSVSDAVVEYRVRPLISDAVVYDWTRLFDEFQNAGILKRFTLGTAPFLLFRARDFLAFCLEKINRDELYLLTSKSRECVEALQRSHGYPFTMDMERPGG